MPYRSVQKGDTVSEYVLVDKLGEGGFGVVWKAEHAQIPGKFVAIKIPTSPEGMDFLRQEAVFQHELDHPNIVKTIGLDTRHDPPYFIMEYVEGRNLRQLMHEDGILPPPYAIDIAVQVCEALAFAHGRGIVHRDLKPENILVEKKRIDVSNRGKALLHYVKITDLGLGMLPGKTQSEIVVSENARTSGVRVLSGTLFYMAPEQMLPGRTSDARVDVYSLGVVLYEMLTGELPLGMDLPSELNPVVTPELDAVCKKALSIDRDRRYQSAREMAGDLQKAKEALLLKLVAQGTPPLEAVPRDARLTPTAAPMPATVRAELPRRAAWVRRGEWALGAFVALLLLACGLAFYKIRRAADLRRDIERRLEAAVATRLNGPLTIDSRPSEALVFFDGQPAGLTPAKIPNPTFARHSVRLQKEFFAPRDLVLEPARDGTRRFRVLDPATGRELAVRDADKGFALEGVDLVRRKGRVEVRTPGVEQAEVRIDGDLYGVTPFSRELDAGEHLFEIRKEGFKEKSFYEKIEGGAKIGREIVLVPDGQPAAESPATHLLRIVSSPEEAVVFVNDEERGRTPCALELPAGRHQLRLEKKFFEPHAVELTVEAPGSREYALARVRTAVAFDSEPRGAAVYVDDRRVGVTPVTAEGIDAGSHTARFVLEGHYDQTATFEVVSREPVDRPVKASLQRIPPGRLAVESEVRGAELWIDGKFAGRAPVAAKVLESGRHRVRVLGAERTVTVEPGGELRLAFSAKDLDLVRVPEGEFKYGSSEARPGEIYARTERTGAYWIDVHEVTNEQYAVFVQHLRETGDHSRCHPDEPKGSTHVPAFMSDPRYNGPRQPVVGITWFDAFAYAAWAGKRLPTEPEWEKAARGRTGWMYPWGNDWQLQEKRCNASGKDDGFEFTAPVGACPGVSPFGCFDMVGNAREWCADDYVTRTGSRQSILGKVLRGGSFLAKEYNTTTMREYENPLHTSATVGFRCVLKAE